MQRMVAGAIITVQASSLLCAVTFQEVLAFFRNWIIESRVVAAKVVLL